MLPAVARLLRSSGHEVYTPTLTGLGERSNLLSPDIDLDLHIRDVVAVLHYEDLRDVILVGHSYGGMVITGAADRAADRIGRVVYLDAANPENGQSLVDVAGPIIESTRPLGAVVDGVELVLLPSPEAGLFYGVTDPDDVAWMADRLTGHPWKCFEQPLRLTNQSAFAALPQYHIVCTSTLATRDPELMEKARADGRLWEIDTGHDLMITEPEAVTEALLQIAARVMSSHPAPPAGIDPLDLVDPERLRAPRLSARGVDAAAGRGAGRVLRAARATNRSGRSPSTPTSSRSRAAGALLERARPHRSGRIGARRASPRRWSSCSIRRGTARLRRVGDAPLHAPRDPVATGRDRPHRGRGARRARRVPTAPRSSTSSSASPRRSRSR